MRPLEHIKSDIRRITSLLVKQSDKGTLECTINGTAPGIPAGFIEALDRADPTHQASEEIHTLLVEYAVRVGRSDKGVVPRTVTLELVSGETVVFHE